MDMGMDYLQMCTVLKGWKFNTNMDYIISPETRALICGSPIAIDSNGSPHIIKTKKPEQRKDMSRYLDMHIPGYCYVT